MPDDGTTMQGNAMPENTPKFTPGPWAIDDRYEGHIYILPASDSGKSAGASFVSAAKHRRDYFRRIAMIDREPYQFDGISRKENAANVRLMAASPELYTALSELLLCHSEGGYVQPDAEVLQAARSAIAKADGR